MKTVLILIGLFGFIVAAAAQTRCSCIANGRRIPEGQTACILPDTGQSFLARCEKILNNTSWKKLQDGCPSASTDGDAASFASLTAPS